MAKIVLDVENKHKDIVLMILKNLKSDLIKNITVDNKSTANTPIKKPLEDEFLPKTSGGGKYLSKEAFKARLQNTKG